MKYGVHYGFHYSNLSQARCLHPGCCGHWPLKAHKSLTSRNAWEVIPPANDILIMAMIQWVSFLKKLSIHNSWGALCAPCGIRLSPHLCLASSSVLFHVPHFFKDCSWEPSSRNHLHYNPCIRLWFWRTLPMTEPAEMNRNQQFPRQMSACK